MIDDNQIRNSLLKTLGQIAVEIPSSIPIFERYGLDYCCGGSRTLEAACEDRHLPVETLRAEIAAAAALSPVQSNDVNDIHARDWAGVPLVEICTYVVRIYHNRFRADLPLILTMIERARQSNQHVAHMLSALKTALRRFRAEFESHMRKEEQVLFPAIQKLEDAVTTGEALPRPSFGSFHNPIYLLEGEHESTGRDLKLIRDLSQDYATVPRADDNYIALMIRLQALEMEIHEHIHVENNVLFPRAIALENAVGLTKRN